MTVVRLKILAK